MNWYPELPWTLYDNLVKREYSVSLKREPRVIIDLGAHLGYSAIYFYLRYWKAQIYAVEADPVTYKKLVRNTRFFKRILPVEAAMGGHEGKVTFYRSNSSLASSLVKTKKANIPCEVEMVSLNTFMKTHGIEFIDLVKFNVEGAEYDIFAHSDRSKIGALIGEYHVNQAGYSLEEFKRMFSAMRIKDLDRNRYFCWINC